MALLTFEAALERVRGDKAPHILLGSGFSSRACLDDIFAYTALFDRADFKGLSPLARKSFDILGTTDSEAVMRALRDPARLIQIYAPDRRTSSSRCPWLSMT